MIDSIKTFWSEMGWFANLLTILLGLITVGTIVYKTYITIKKVIINNRFSYSDFGSFVSDKFNKWDPASLKRKKYVSLMIIQKTIQYLILETQGSLSVIFNLYH